MHISIHEIHSQICQWTFFIGVPYLGILEVICSFMFPKSGRPPPSGPTICLCWSPE
jgi:hypothetical protein